MLVTCPSLAKLPTVLIKIICWIFFKKTGMVPLCYLAMLSNLLLNSWVQAILLSQLLVSLGLWTATRQLPLSQTQHEGSSNLSGRVPTANLICTVSTLSLLPCDPRYCMTTSERNEAGSLRVGTGIVCADVPSFQQTHHEWETAQV